ncbi:MAG: DUF1974 domain-containing protein, partial [Balneolaceae bacterium]
ITRGRLTSSPVNGPAAKYYRKLAWSSASFAFLADMALGSYGGGLKIKEKISGRFADILSWMYLATATLRRFEAQGRREEHLPFFEWSMQYAFAQIQNAFDAIYREIKVPGFSWIFRGPVALWSRINRIGTMPSDRTGHKVAQAMQAREGARISLSDNIYVSKDPEDAMGRYEEALTLITQAEPAYEKVKRAVKKGDLDKKHIRYLVDEALEKGIISSREADLLAKAEEARSEAVRVDEFSLEEYERTTLHTPQPAAESSGSSMPSHKRS